MAPTMKHRRSKQKRKHKRGSNRYDKLLTKFKTMKSKGGSFLTKAKDSGEMVLPHRVSNKNQEYKGVKIVRDQKEK